MKNTENTDEKSINGLDDASTNNFSNWSYAHLHDEEGHHDEAKEIIQTKSGRSIEEQSNIFEKL